MDGTCVRSRCGSLVAGTSGLAFADVAVTACGQSVQQSGYMVADLDCSAESTDAPTLVLGHAATLDLGGFTLTGRTNTQPTVQCSGRCDIVGPGTIVGSGGAVVSFGRWEDGRHIRIFGATITEDEVVTKVATADDWFADARF